MAPRPSTANRLGRTGTTLNEINEAFVAFAATADGPVLDIGCAYGIAARAALAAGATVVANDVGLDHLDRPGGAMPAGGPRAAAPGAGAFPPRPVLPAWEPGRRPRPPTC